MKAKIVRPEPEPKQFEPVTFQITCETIEELRGLALLSNMVYSNIERFRNETLFEGDTQTLYSGHISPISIGVHGLIYSELVKKSKATHEG